MSTLVVIGYDDQFKAEEVRLSLMKMQKDYLIDLEDAVVAVKDPQGKVKLHQAVNLTATGAVSGGFWGSLIGLLFLNPLLGMAVGAGCTPYLAVEVAVRWAPPLMSARLARVRDACALGATFADALDDLAARAPPLRPVADALLASDRLGAPVGPALGRLATEQRAELRRRAEAHARRVPVRLLFPLVFVVLPAFGLLTVIPTLLAGFSRL